MNVPINKVLIKKRVRKYAYAWESKESISFFIEEITYFVLLRSMLCFYFGSS